MLPGGDGFVLFTVSMAVSSLPPVSTAGGVPSVNELGVCDRSPCPHQARGGRRRLPWHGVCVSCAHSQSAFRTANCGFSRFLGMSKEDDSLLESLRVTFYRLLAGAVRSSSCRTLLPKPFYNIGFH